DVAAAEEAQTNETLAGEEHIVRDCYLSFRQSERRVPRGGEAFGIAPGAKLVCGLAAHADLLGGGDDRAEFGEVAEKIGLAAHGPAVAPRAQRHRIERRNAGPEAARWADGRRVGVHRGV